MEWGPVNLPALEMDIKKPRRKIFARLPTGQIRHEKPLDRCVVLILIYLLAIRFKLRVLESNQLYLGYEPSELPFFLPAMEQDTDFRLSCKLSY